MQRRIQHRRMNPKPPYRHTLRESDVGENLGPPPPQGLQTPKRRPIPIPPRRQHLIPVGDVHRPCPNRRPHRQLRGRLHRANPQHALRVQRPSRTRIRLAGSRIHPHIPSTRLLDAAHHHLDPHPICRQHQRCLQRQLLQHRTTHLVTGPQGQLNKPRAREQHHRAHRMIGQPRRSDHRYPARQHHPTRVGPLHHCSQQSMLGAHQADTTQIAANST
ncbi:Uncharacterised protein [Mycobacterium tuberculosis]|nr:Uncharacterised protein [Mycobacterium tuberculosis]